MLAFLVLQNSLRALTQSLFPRELVLYQQHIKARMRESIKLLFQKYTMSMGMTVSTKIKIYDANNFLLQTKQKAFMSELELII